MGKTVRRSSSPWQRREPAPQGPAASSGNEPGGTGVPPRDSSDSVPAGAPPATVQGPVAAPSVSASGPARPIVPGGAGHLLPAPPSVSASAIVAIARVLRAHGVGGEFKVQILCSGPEHFLECVDTGEVLLQREGLPGTFLAPVESVRPIPEGALVSIEGIETREAVEALRGAILGLSEDRLPACEPDTYYHHQLEGLRVVAAGDHAEIGTVVRVEDSPGHDQLVVRPKAETGRVAAAGDGDGAESPVGGVDRVDEVDGADEVDGVDRVDSGGVDQSALPSESTESTEPRAPRPRRGPRKKAGDRPKSRDFLIPFVGAFVARVDLAGGCIEVTLPPGFAESQR